MKLDFTEHATLRFSRTVDLFHEFSGTDRQKCFRIIGIIDPCAALPLALQVT
jgi:hypothetical protein